MLCIPIIGPTIEEAQRQLIEGLSRADLFEFRFDLFDPFTIDTARQLRHQVDKPVIFTLRKSDQGGHFYRPEAERLQLIQELAQCSPTYIDLEYDLSPNFVSSLRQQFPSLQIIVSYHDFSTTPRDLESILKGMKDVSADLYKIACMARSTNDALRMLLFIKNHAPLLGMCMGELGEITRILAPLMGSPWTYASLSHDQQTAPGQIAAHDLEEIYHLSQRHHSSQIYGLIGGSLSKSMSHRVHNALMKHFSLDAIYVKMEVQIKELKDFFLLARQLRIRGLSVTMPLKEAIITLLDEVDPQAAYIGAVNTIVSRDGTWSGYNTDGRGALDAIEAHFPVRQRHMAILGAGGAARSIISEAIARGAQVAIFNRTQEKALQLGKHFNVKAAGLEEVLNYPYDILINTTPEPLPIPAEAIHPSTVVMDIKTFPKMTPLLEEAAAKNCQLIFGYEMFVRQAVAQYTLWFPHFNPSSLYPILLNTTLKHLS